MAIATRVAQATWEGNLKQGKGTIELGPDVCEVNYGFAARFEDSGPGTNPEELIGGAHAGCFSMALAHALGEMGHPPVRIQSTAHVHLAKSGDGFEIPKIELETEAEVPGIDEATFKSVAEDAKDSCPVSKLVSAAEITLKAKLLSGQSTRASL